MEGAQEGAKGRRAGRVASKGKGASSKSTADMRPSAQATTATSVPRPPPGSPHRTSASMTLVSMGSMGSDSSLLRLHAKSPAVVSLPSRVDIPVMLHALFCAMMDNLLGTRLILTTKLVVAEKHDFSAEPVQRSKTKT